MTESTQNSDGWVDLPTGDKSLCVQARVFGKQTFNELETQLEAINGIADCQYSQIPTAKDVPSLLEAGFSAGFFVNEKDRHGDIMLARADQNQPIDTLAPYYEADTVVIRTKVIANNAPSL